MRVNLKFTIDAKDAAKSRRIHRNRQVLHQEQVFTTRSRLLTVSHARSGPLTTSSPEISAEGYIINPWYTPCMRLHGEDFLRRGPNHKGEAFNDRTFDTFVANADSRNLDA